MVGARIRSVEWQTELRYAHRSGFVRRWVKATLAAKARLRLSWLVAMRIAQAARLQRHAASLMPLRTVGSAVGQGGRAVGSARANLSHALNLFNT